MYSVKNFSHILTSSLYEDKNDDIANMSINNGEKNVVEDNSRNNDEKQTSKYKSLVFSGGGHKGLLHFGSILYLKSKEDNLLNDITEYYGTSVGALNILFATLPITMEYLRDYVVDRPWHKELSITFERLINLTKESEGLLDHTFFDRILFPLLDFCEMSREISFEEYYVRTGKSLHMFATCVNDLSVFICDRYKTPNMSIVSAVKMSCNIPYLFEPYIYEDKKYIDGFVYAHFPLYYAQYDILCDLRNDIQSNNICLNNDISIQKYIEKYLHTHLILGCDFNYKSNGSIILEQNYLNNNMERNEENENDEQHSSINTVDTTCDNDNVHDNNSTPRNIISFFKELNIKLFKKLERYDNKEKYTQMYSLLQDIIQELQNDNNTEYCQYNHIVDIIMKSLLRENTHIITYPVDGFFKYSINTLFNKQLRDGIVRMGYDITKTVGI